jgi:xylulokinase
MTTPAALGIDLGTSSVKAMLLDPGDGSVLAQADAPYPVDRPHLGWAETDPDQWWDAVRQTVAAVTATAADRTVAGIGLSGQMHGVVLCDADGSPTRPAVLWADSRAEAELDLYRSLPADGRARLANPLSPGMAGPILAWLHRHEPQAVSRARHALQPKDWIRARLTGQFAAEPSDASGTLLYDVLTEGWSEPVVTALGLRRDLLPPILASADAVAGRLTEAAAAMLGLLPGVPVAAGAADTAAAMLGAGLVEPGVLQLTIGTGVQIVTPVRPPTAEQLQQVGSPVTHLYRSAVTDGWYAMAAGMTGGQTLDWVRRVLGAEWAELYAAADRPPEPDDPIFLPHLVGERTPYLDTTMRGAWTALSPRHDRTTLLHAALEGVAFAVADELDALPGVPAAGRELRLAGGGTTSPGWRQLLADVLDARLHAVEVPGASARGAALLGARAGGLTDGPRLRQITTARTALVAEPGPLADDRHRRRSSYLATLQALRAVQR